VLSKNKKNSKWKCNSYSQNFNKYT